MARRDVEFVIKAKDQAAKVVDAITNAINDFVGAQGDLVKAGGKTDSVLSGLGAALLTLDKTFRGMSGAQKLQAEIAKVNKAFETQQKEAVDTAKRVADLGAQYSAAQANTAKLRDQSDKLNQTLGKLEKSTAKAKDAQSARNKTLGDAKTAVGRLTREEASAVTALEKQGATVEATRVKLAGYAQALTETSTPTKKLQNDFNRTTETLGRQEQKLAEMRAGLAGTRAALTDASANFNQLSAAVTKAGEALTKQNAKIADTKAEIATLKQAVREAGQQEIGLTRSIDNTKASLAAQEAALKGAETAMAGFAAQSADAQAALERFAQEARGPLSQAFRAQQSTVSQLNNTFQANREQLAKLSQEMSRVGVPTKEMVDTMARLNAVGREIQSTYAAEQAKLKAMALALKEAGTDTKALEAITQQFAATLAHSTTELARLQAEARGAATANSKIADASRRAQIAQEGLNREMAQAAGATDKTASSTNRLADAYKRMYGEGRTALSLTQRLRGEVLSLAAAYGGVFAVIETLGGVVDATRKVEAAQVRLNALYGGDKGKAAAEFEFIRREADRLGVDIGVLAEQYTKFAAATKGTNLAGEETRRIFLKIAEAGAVNNLSLEDMEGIFRAVIQIASKGKVQLEELQGQLGDRLPGALQIMADGLGITVAELQKMTKAGEVGSDALSKFADNLQERYGNALPEALKQTSTVIGRFGNAVTTALLAFGKGGFIEGFNDLLTKMTETMKSADFQAFSQNVSSAFGFLAKTLGFLAEHFRLTTAAITIFLTLRIAPFLSGLIVSLTTAVGAMGAVRGAIAGMITSFRFYAQAAGVAASAVTSWSLALRALLSATGIGLAITALATAISLVASTASNSQQTLSEHRDLIDKIKNAYDNAAGSADAWKIALEGVTLTEINRKIIEATENVQGFMDGFKKTRATVVSGLGPVQDEYRAVAQSVLEGKSSLDDFLKTLDALAQTTGDARIKKWAEEQITAMRGFAEPIRILREFNLVKEALTKGDEAGKKAIDELVNGGKEVTKTFDDASKSANKYKEALAGIKDFIPSLKGELEKLKDTAKLDELVANLMKAGPLSREQLELITSARSAIDAKHTNYEAQFTAGRATPQGADLQKIVEETSKLAERMGLSTKDLLTVISYESAFRKDIMGGAKNQYYGLFQASPDVQKQYGLGPGVSDIAKQIEALGKYLKERGVKEGDGLLQIYAAINAGNAKNIHASDANNGGRPGTVLDKVSTDMDNNKRIADGLLAAYSGAVKAATDLQKADDKRVEKTKELADAEKAASTQAQLEAQFAKSDIITKQTELELAQERAKYEKDGVPFTKAVEDSIRRRVALQYQEQAVKEKLQKAEEAVNTLITRREELLKQAALYTTAGKSDAAKDATSAAAALVPQIDAATQAAIKMWEAIGGADALSKVETLKTANLEAQKLATTGNATAAMWTSIGQSIGDHLVDAFDQFAQAVANGENAWKALGIAIQQAAAQILIDIGKMIIKQAIFNALSGIFPGLVPGANGLFHSGTDGVIGSGTTNRTRSVSPATWAMAPRFHGGYSPGLKRNEIPAILENTEEVLTKDDPRHIWNVGKGGDSGGKSPTNIRIVNTIDAGDFVQEGLNTGQGEEAILNTIRRNKNSIRETLS